MEELKNKLFAQQALVEELNATMFAMHVFLEQQQEEMAALKAAQEQQEQEMAALKAAQEQQEQEREVCASPIGITALHAPRTILNLGTVLHLDHTLSPAGGDGGAERGAGATGAGDGGAGATGAGARGMCLTHWHHCLARTPHHP